MSRKRHFKLGDLVTLKRGYDLPERERTAGKYPIISSSGATGTHNQFRVVGPGVVTGRYGTIGEVFYVPSEFWPLNTSLYVQDFKGNNRRLVAYFLETILSASFNSAGAVPGVNRNILHKLRIPEPPKDQTRIAAILSTYDDLIENYKQRIALLEKLGWEIYREWFVRFRFPGHERGKKIKGVPDGWEVKRISEVVNFLSGYSFKSGKYTPSGELGIVTIKNVQNGYFIPDCTDFIDEPPGNMRAHCVLNAGDVLMSLTGNVGRVCHVYGSNLLLNQRVAKLESKLQHGSQFVYYTFNNRSMIQLIENLSLGSTAQMNLSPIQLGKQKLVVPEPDLLIRFENAIRPLTSLKLNLYDQCENLKKARDGLLPRLISGKLSTEDLDIQFPPGMAEEMEAVV